MRIPARQLTPLTLIQSTTSVATGKGHQDAEAAMGTITFFNGLFTSQTIAAGTTLTGSDGVQVVTDQLAVIPAAWASTPPTYGQVTVSAHALYPGPQGNISVHDINQTCCLPSVLAQNAAAFHGGQRERDYTVVSSKDIDRGVAGLTTTLIQSAQAAFTAQLTTHEALVTPDCKRTVTADHQAGAEAAAVTVRVSEQCTAIAYDAAALRERATRMFTYELARREGIHYRLLGAVQVSVLHARFIDQKRGGRKSYRAHGGNVDVPVQPAGTPTDQATRRGQNTASGSTHPVGPARNTASNHRRDRREQEPAEG